MRSRLAIPITNRHDLPWFEKVFVLIYFALFWSFLAGHFRGRMDLPK